MTDLPPIRNDSGKSVEEIMALLDRDGVEIQYGEMMVKAERRALEDARRYVAGLDADQRRRSMLSVDNALRRALPKIKRGHFSKKTADNFHSDVLLWTALKEVSVG